MSFIAGFDGRLYYQTTGTRDFWGTSEDGDVEVTGDAPANLEEVELAQDVSLKIDPNEWDASSRAGRGFDASEPTTIRAEITFQLIWDPDDGFCQALISALFGRTKLAIACLDGASDEAGSQGLWADTKAFGTSREEKLKEGMVVPITLKPCVSSVHPQWVTVAGASA